MPFLRSLADGDRLPQHDSIGKLGDDRRTRRLGRRGAAEVDQATHLAARQELDGLDVRRDPIGAGAGPDAVLALADAGEAAEAAETQLRRHPCAQPPAGNTAADEPSCSVLAKCPAPQPVYGPDPQL